VKAKGLNFGANDSVLNYENMRKIVLGDVQEYVLRAATISMLRSQQTARDLLARDGEAAAHVARTTNGSGCVTGCRVARWTRSAKRCRGGGWRVPNKYFTDWCDSLLFAILFQV